MLMKLAINKLANKQNFKLYDKAFTLIELLAIIVILAIIAVITVPIILNIIDNSKKGAAIDSAYGYKKAINQYYATANIGTEVASKTSVEQAIYSEIVADKASNYIAALLDDVTIQGHEKNVTNNYASTNDIITGRSKRK